MKNYVSILEHLLSLLVVFLMLAATALWSGKFLGRHWLEEKEQQVAAVEASVTLPTDEEMKKMGIEGMELVPRDSISWNVVSAEGNREGVVVSSLSLTPDVIGYHGNTPLFIYINDDKEVQAVVAMVNDETPRFFSRAEKGILDKWDGLKVSDALDLEVDAVSGATYTSFSLIENAKAALSAYSATAVYHDNAPVIGWGRTVALFSVFALGIILTFRKQRKKWQRTLVLLLNVGVTGFWCGQFLSLSILHGWIENGVDPLLYLPTLVMLLIALAMPFFKKPNHYCTWMCPYGSLQELAWMLPLPKIKVGAKAYRVMTRIRFGLLMVLLFAMWMGFGFSLMDYEPFTAFVVASAAPAVMVIAGVFVILGIFVPHVWCRCICPVGMLLNLAEDKK